MKLTSTDLDELVDLALLAAKEAGEMVATTRPEKVEHKAEGASLASVVVTEIDRRSEDIILDILRPTLERYELGLLTEEQVDDGSRLTADYFWSIDPLDGTLPFIEGIPGYSISIALVRRDGTPTLGVVYDPVEETTFHALTGAGVFRNGQTWLSEPLPQGEVLSVFADRSFLDREDELVDALDQIARDLGLKGIQLDATRGGVLNACGVLANPPGCYFKFPAPSGGGGLWDFAASAALFQQSGAVATDIHGDPLDLNRPDSTSMSHRGVLYATNEAIASRIRSLHLNRE